MSGPFVTFKDPSCGDQAPAAVGTSVTEVVASVAADPRLVVTPPQAVTVGGRSGQMVDISVAPTWTGTCDWSAGKGGVLIVSATTTGPAFGIGGTDGTATHSSTLTVGSSRSTSGPPTALTSTRSSPKRCRSSNPSSSDPSRRHDRISAREPRAEASARSAPSCPDAPARRSAPGGIEPAQSRLWNSRAWRVNCGAARGGTRRLRDQSRRSDTGRQRSIPAVAGRATPVLRLPRPGWDRWLRQPPWPADPRPSRAGPGCPPGPSPDRAPRAPSSSGDLPVVCWIFSASCWVIFFIAEAVPTTSMPPMIRRRRRRRRTIRRIARRLNISAFSLSHSGP